MICELDPTEFVRVLSLVHPCKQFIPVRAVIDGNYPGRIFVDRREAPQTAYVWCYRRAAYGIGEFRNPSFLQGLRELICEVVAPASGLMNIYQHEIYAPNTTEWVRVLEGALAPFRPQIHIENAFVFNRATYQRLRQPIVVPAQRRIEWMQAPVAPTGLPGWPRAGIRFRQRLKFGFGLVTGNTLIAYCGSSGFVSDKEFMVEVDTFDPKDRRRGYATLVSTALLDYCVDQDYSPVWETTETNVGSRRIAEKLGFTKRESYPVFTFEL